MIKRLVFVAVAVLLIAFVITGMAVTAMHGSQQEETYLLERIESMRPTVESLPDYVYVYAAWIRCADLSTGQRTDIIRLTWPLDAQETAFRACHRRQP